MCVWVCVRASGLCPCSPGWLHSISMEKVGVSLADVRAVVSGRRLVVRGQVAFVRQTCIDMGNAESEAARP